MPKERSPGKPTARRYSPEEKGAAVRMVRALWARAGHRAGHGVPGGPSARLRGRVGSFLGAPGRHRRWVCLGYPLRRPSGSKSSSKRYESSRVPTDSETSGKFLRRGARPPTQEMVDFIDTHREEFGVESIITVLRTAGVTVAPSTYYDTKTRPPPARAQRDAELGPALR
jgi:hypothetical protein